MTDIEFINESIREIILANNIPFQSYNIALQFNKPPLDDIYIYITFNGTNQRFFCNLAKADINKVISSTGIFVSNLTPQPTEAILTISTNENDFSKLSITNPPNISKDGIRRTKKQNKIRICVQIFKIFSPTASTNEKLGIE